jgi:hypothetical protein
VTLPCVDAGASVVNGKICVVGGSPGPEAAISNMEEYDPVTDTWTRKTNRPTARSFRDTILCVGACGPGNRGRATTVFSGVIDDVRIYNRAVQP